MLEMIVDLAPTVALCAESRVRPVEGRDSLLTVTVISKLVQTQAAQ